MPVANIVDHRTNSYNVNVMAIFEDSYHDNVVKDATQFEVIDDIMYLGIKETTIEKAIMYATTYIKSRVTLYLYNVGEENYSDYDTIEDAIKNRV